MDYLQEAKDYFNSKPRNLNLATAAALIAQAEELRNISLTLTRIDRSLGNTEALPNMATSLAALVELSTGGTLTDTVGDGDFTDGLDDEREVPF